MDRIATLTVLQTLIKVLVDKGVLSKDDERYIYMESIEILSNIEPGTDSTKELVAEAIAYLRYAAGE